MAKEGFLRTAIQEMKYLINKPCAVVREGMKQVVEFPGHKKVKAAIQRHPAMLRHNQTSSAKVQIDYRLRYAHTRTRAAHSKLPVDPCATRSL
jgi:hypothetical protein